MIKKVTVGTKAVKISQGARPKTLKIFNNSAKVVYVLSDPTQPITEGYPIPVSGTAPQYENYYAKGDYYLLSDTDGLDVRVEET